MPDMLLDLANPTQARIAARLDQEEYAYFTTVRPDGRPHSIPVCFLWDGASILIFSQPNNVKCRNLAQNPHVSLALDSFRPDMFPIVVEGTAKLIDEPGVDFLMPAYAAKYAPLAQRLGVTLERLSRVYTQAIRMMPTKIRQDT